MYTQYSLQNAEDNNHSGNDFLLNINHSSVSPHATIYPKNIIDFILEDTVLWKKIGK